MKIKIVLSLAVFFMALLLVPITNLVGNMPLARDALKESRLVEFFFNVDFLEGYLNRLLFDFGFSSDPEQAIVGKDGWVFLGDKHVNVMSETRGMSEPDVGLISGIHLARQAWHVRIKNQGGLGLYVMIAPNKHSVYSENLPDWAVAAEPRKMVSAFLETGRSDSTLIDLYESMLKAKAEAPYSLYYKTDTHWNNLGAWYGYKAMSEAIGRSHPWIKWLTDESVVVTGEIERAGGDLSNFLRLRDYLTDREVGIEITQDIKVHRSALHADGQKSENESVNIDSPQVPVLMESKNALNNMKVLWLRDSFGDALSPYMEATFSTLVRQHFGAVLGEPAVFQKLIDEFKPDLVIMTTVERQSFVPFFANMPPVIVRSEDKAFAQVSHGVADKVVLHQLSSVDGELFEVTGGDPFIEMPLSSIVDGQKNTLLGFDFNCEEASSPNHSIQLFWHDRSKSWFSEEDSVRFDAGTGHLAVDLSASASWSKSREIQSIRLDLNSPSCKKMSFKNISLGTVLN